MKMKMYIYTHTLTQEYKTSSIDSLYDQGYLSLISLYACLSYYKRESKERVLYNIIPTYYKIQPKWLVLENILSELNESSTLLTGYWDGDNGKQSDFHYKKCEMQDIRWSYQKHYLKAYLMSSYTPKWSLSPAHFHLTLEDGRFFFCS